MVGFNMNGPTRDQVLKFMEDKDRIEREIQELNHVLESNMNVGMQEPLVDAEGFPRADIDVFRVRHARHRIICLQNDHKEIMKQIERGIHTVHQQFIMGPTGEGTSRSRLQTDQPMDVTESSSAMRMTNGYHNGNGVDSRLAVMVEATNNLRVSDRAFVKVTFVSPGSPADNAGIRVGDEVVQFGSVNAGNFNSLSQIADVVQHSVGARVEVRLRRGDDSLNIALVPATWSGRGLLGCNIVPL